ncbi:biotin-(acetyl-CoA carboxylase) ligase [Candidatus Termititenax persephonae]|uniref:biotin--[biotin carboxyl-carrier protein] ligase n=1 Tax=Candidatus Termititenax persephonae TaxID=2218525 RepID=A0A388THB1_9BACT|nr:biotin-(acetyl-CoA carboxylase) ligase [Candidatus Termititenax persephonae]
MLINLTSVDSTNKYALANLAGLNDRDVVVAETQTAGRGRLNRRWVSPPGENIYCSIVLKNQRPNPLLTILAALAVAQTIRQSQIDAQIKWPNDIMVNGKKIGGVLAESNSKGLVIGLGVNVNMSAVAAAQIDKPATSLKIETGQAAAKEKILQEILEKFFALYGQVQQEGFAKLLKIWQNELQIINKKVRVQTAGGEIYGTVIQIDNDGALLVETAQGQVRVLAGDVYVA